MTVTAADGYSSLEIMSEEGALLSDFSAYGSLPTLCLMTSGELVLRAEGIAIWSPPPVVGFSVRRCLPVGDTRRFFGTSALSCIDHLSYVRQCRYIRNGNFYLELNYNGVLMISTKSDFDELSTIWRSSDDEHAFGVYRFNISTMGIYASNGSRVDGWDLPKGSPPATHFCLHFDGNLALYSNNDVIWSRPRITGFGNNECASRRSVGKLRIHNGTYVSCLLRGDSMKPCDYVATGDTVLLFRADANLILSDTSSRQQLWTTGLVGNIWGERYEFSYQSDGNMVIYDANLFPLLAWSNSSSPHSTDLCVTSNGLVLYDGMDTVWEAPSIEGFSQCRPVGHHAKINGNEHTCLRPGEQLLSCQYLRAGSIYLLMQTDGILSLFSDYPFKTTLRDSTDFPYATRQKSKLRWASSETSFDPACGPWNASCGGNFKFELSSNGTMSIHSALQAAVAQYSVNSTSEDLQLCLQSDGDFVLYDEHVGVWAYPSKSGFQDGEKCGPRGGSPSSLNDPYQACFVAGDIISDCSYMRVGSYYLTMHRFLPGNLAIYNGTRGSSVQVWESSYPVYSNQENWIRISSGLSEPYLFFTEGYCLRLEDDYFQMVNSGNKKDRFDLSSIRGFIRVRPNTAWSNWGPNMTTIGSQYASSWEYFYANEQYVLISKDCDLQFYSNTSLLWFSNTTLLSEYGCAIYLQGDGVVTVGVRSGRKASSNNVVVASDPVGPFFNGAVLCVEVGRVVLRDANDNIVWNSLDARRVNDTTTVGFQQNGSICGPLGHYKTFKNGLILANCILPGQLLQVCQYLRIGSYYLNMTEYSNLELNYGRPVTADSTLVWKSADRTRSKNMYGAYKLFSNGSFYFWDTNRSNRDTSSVDLMTGIDSDEFCLLSTGTFGLFSNDSIVWSRPNRNGFNGFNDDVCWNQPDSETKAILSVGHYRLRERMQISCMKRGETMQPCQRMTAGNYSLGFQMLFDMSSPKLIQTQGNLVLVTGIDLFENVIWSVNARFTARRQIQLSFDESGDIVVYDGKSVVSNLGTTIGKDSSDFCVQSDGRLVLYNIVGDVWDEVWSNPKENGFNGFGGDRCGFVGHKESINDQNAVCMHPGDSFRSCQFMNVGDYFFTINANSTAVVYKGTRAMIKKIIWSSIIEYSPSIEAKFVFGMDHYVNITNGQLWNPNITLIDAAISKQADQLCLLPDGSLSLFDSKNTALWTAGIPSRAFKSQQLLVQGRECGNVGHWRPAINGILRKCMLPGENLRICQWMNIDDLWFTWAARINSFDNVELMLYRGGMYFKSEVLWSAGTNIPNSLFSMLYFEYQTNGNLVLTTNGTEVVGVTNLLTDQEKSSHLCLQSDAKIVLYDPLENVVWHNPGNVTGFSGSGNPCE
ncbi:hypothetical protein BDR26DRAFT_869971 [Obelidium mucronatum]|nr:hypothetical protein BDR26DRAFT_869971 [Obelidium mucronatum]